MAKFCKQNYVTRWAVDLTAHALAASAAAAQNPVDIAHSRVTPKAAPMRLLSYNCVRSHGLHSKNGPSLPGLSGGLLGPELRILPDIQMSRKFTVLALQCVSLIYHIPRSSCCKGPSEMGATLMFLVALASALPVALSSGDDNSFLEANGYTDWIPGHATWYGDPYGEGSNGGACGYTELAGTPYGLSVAAGSAIIFENGQGCGQCFDVKCSYASCKQEPTRVVITDSCPGGTYCSTGEPAFDLSGMAMSNMALPGRDQELRNLGLYAIQYKRVPCYYPNQNIAFKVDPGSTPYWMSFTVKYQGGPGDIESVQVRQAGRAMFQPMQHNWGANYMLICYSGQPFRGPYDVMITARLNGHAVIAEHVIPNYFEPGALYESNVQLAY